MSPPPSYSSGDSVETPEFIIDYLKSEYGPNMMDPCPFQLNFDPSVHTDGLKIDWTDGDFAFCNPPYSRVKPWFIKGVQEWKKNQTVVFLIKTSCSQTKYFKEYSTGAELKLINHKIKFKGYDNVAWFPLMLVIFHHDKSKQNTWSSFSFTQNGL